MLPYCRLLVAPNSLPIALCLETALHPLLPDQAIQVFLAVTLRRLLYHQPLVATGRVCVPDCVAVVPLTPVGHTFHPLGASGPRRIEFLAAYAPRRRIARIPLSVYLERYTRAAGKNTELCFQT